MDERWNPATRFAEPLYATKCYHVDSPVTLGKLNIPAPGFVTDIILFIKALSLLCGSRISSICAFLRRRKVSAHLWPIPGPCPGPPW
jgi:hypothetical protein